MSETDDVLKNIKSFSREIRGTGDYESLLCFCSDLRKDNWAGNKPICQETSYHPCPGCFACEAGNRMLRYLRKAL